jgi:diguanylate cyclase (GGDEF)-like protein
VFQKLKYITFAAIFVLLSARFFFMAWDPYWGGADLNDGLAVYRDWRSVLDTIYYITGFLMWPIYQLSGLVNSLFHLDWTYGAQTSVLTEKMVQEIAKLPNMQEKVGVLETPMFKQTMLGYIDYLAVGGMIFYRVLDPLVDVTVDAVKNLVWNLLIEFSFTKRKEATYKEALGQRAADLTKLKVEYKNLSKEANMLAKSVITDELTKVYNKRFFLEKMTYEFKTAKEKRAVLALCMVDIDHFKKLNDNYGHLVGDKVLKAVASVANSSTPKGAFCCRFGGEEFAIIMPGKNVEEARAIIAKIHQSLPLLRFDDDANLRTSASFGLCVADFSSAQAQALENFEGLIKISDDLLYKAKLNGRNRIELEHLC